VRTLCTVELFRGGNAEIIKDEAPIKLAEASCMGAIGDFSDCNLKHP